MKKSTLIFALLLSGCASDQSSEATPEQRQMALQLLMNQQRQPPPQPYVLPMPAPVQPIQQPAPRSCVSNVNGQTITTNCY